MSENSEELAGRVLGGYRVETLLGKGGMGAVYRGTDEKLGRPVALKILLKGALVDEEAVKRFEREARLLADINHPNIAQVYAIGEEEGLHYYAMEYIEGSSLADFLKENQRLGGRRCIRYMVEAAQGLKAAAEKGITHRDIKPANIMIPNSGPLKIVDFGIAKIVADDTLKTATGIVMGTPQYMSPEQGKGEAIDHRSDIYSLGATFYHMVCGRPPFEADTALNVVMKHMTEPVQPIPDYNANVPEKLCSIIYAMLEKNPNNRYQNYADLIHALESIFDTGDTSVRRHAPPSGALPPVSSVEITEKARSEANRLRNWVIALGAAVVLLLGILIINSGKSGKSGKSGEQGERPERPAPARGLGSPLKETLQDLHDFQKQLDDEKK